MSITKSFYKAIIKKMFCDPCEVVFWDGDVEKFGEGENKFKIVFHEQIPKAEIIKDPSMALGEGYMNGKFDIEGSVRHIIRAIIDSDSGFLGSNGKGRKFLGKVSNSVKLSKANASFHYDLGNDFYKLWLDDTMTYSCGYFKSVDDPLKEAQINKADHILRKLCLREGQSLLDIGCGWGHLLVDAVKKYKVKATGLTLSAEQYNYVSERIKEEGLEELADVRYLDYREMKNKRFDRIVSVGMLEHVGEEHLAEYFSQVKRLLQPSGGVSMLHCITSQEKSDTNSWISKYIFPGGYIPTLSQLVSELIEGGFQILDIENLRRHYTRTLECWTANFENALPEIRAGRKESFIRMWRLYLNACAASFDAGALNLHQILFSNGNNDELPWTRDYMYT